MVPSSELQGEELAPGLWRWTAPHPDWTPEEGGPDGWERDVGCVLYDAHDAVLLIDPLAPPERERFWLALDGLVAGRPLAVLLTVFWHQRGAQEVLERYPGATLWANERAVDRLEVSPTKPFRPGDTLPGGVQAFDARRADEVVYWLPEHGALVTGAVLLGAEGGGVRLFPQSWVARGPRPAEVAAELGPLLELPVEMVLVSHGNPVLAGAREALARALEA